MARFEELPVEITTGILDLLCTCSLASILRVNHNLHHQALTSFRSWLELNLSSLIRCPLVTGNVSSRGHETQSVKAIDLQQVKAVIIHLEHCSPVFHTLSGLSFTYTGERNRRYLTPTNFNRVVRNALSAFSASIYNDPTSTSRLTHLCLYGYDQYRPGIFPNISKSGIFTACIQQHNILDFLRAGSACRNLRYLELDTSEVEETEWSPASGVGHNCKRHICRAFASVAKQLAALREVRWRRRDICPVFFEAWTGTEAALEVLIVDLRLRNLQQTGSDCYGAHARHCCCRCWCVDCLKRCHGGNDRVSSLDPDSIEEIVDTKSGRQLDAHFVAMIKAGTQSAAHMRQCMVFNIFGYEQPERELANWTREPVVVDCLRRVKRPLRRVDGCST